VGDRAPDFEIRLVDGTLVTFAGLVAESRPTFLFFFATW
jgi:peroxiredoxin